MDRKLDVIALAGILFVLIHSASAGAQNQARADIKNAEGKSIGTASLRETKDGVLLTVNVKGLPQGLHAVHFHSVGKCEGPAFTSAGPHFNPFGKKHGLKNPAGPHAGDLADMYVQKNGVGRYEALTDSIPSSTPMEPPSSSMQPLTTISLIPRAILGIGSPAA
jgi:superoxide dismutase, Cu-Zn family